MRDKQKTKKLQNGDTPDKSESEFEGKIEVEKSMTRVTYAANPDVISTDSTNIR